MRGADLWNIWVQGVQILNKCAGAFLQISGIVCKDNIGCDIAVFNRFAYLSLIHICGTPPAWKTAVKICVACSVMSMM